MKPLRESILSSDFDVQLPVKTKEGEALFNALDKGKWKKHDLSVNGILCPFGDEIFRRVEMLLQSYSSRASHGDKTVKLYIPESSSPERIHLVCASNNGRSYDHLRIINYDFGPVISLMEDSRDDGSHWRKSGSRWRELNSYVSRELWDVLLWFLKTNI